MVGYSPLDEVTLRDHAANYHYLREGAPVSLFEGYDPPFYILSRYEDVEAALRDIEVFSSARGQGPRHTPPSGMVCDPPMHTLHRGLCSRPSRRGRSGP